MNILKWLLLCAATKIINLVVLVEADYLVAIRIQDYESECDDCGTYFRYCVQSFDGKRECLESHQYVQPGVPLDFSKEFLLLRHNPILFRGPTKQWEGVKIYLAALDSNSPDIENLLTEAHVNLTTDDTQLGVETTPVVYTGQTGHTNITATFVVTCAEHWYGQTCNLWCQKDCTCDLPVSCHDNCRGVVCGENRYCVDGVDVYVCTCDDGFTGRYCEINLNECEGMNCSGNGRCIDGIESFYCECDYPYSGTMCEKFDGDASLTADKRTLPYLISGIVGWCLLIFITLAMVMAIVFTRLTKQARSGSMDNNVRPQGMYNATFHQQDGFAPSINNGHNQPNISYQAIPPERGTLQLPGLVTTKVDLNQGERESTLIYNHGYEASQHGVYEVIA